MRMKYMASIANGTPYERKVVGTICKIKNLPSIYLPSSANRPIQLNYRDTMLEGLATIIYFLDQKYPAPEMLIGDPETKSTIFMLANTAANNIEKLNELLVSTHDADSYLLGNIISLADVLLAPLVDVIPNPRYKRTLTEALAKWNDSSSSSYSPSS